MKKFKCPFCDEVSTELTGIHAHLEHRHKDNLPQGVSVEESYYNLRTGKTHGNCVVCKRETEWNPATNKYHRFCGRAVCKETYVNEFKKRMIGVHGKTTLLNDPDQQRKMLANRSISGEYKWSDGKKKPYTGSYEKDFLQFLDLFMEFDSEDIFAPSPHTYYYEYDGKKHFYIPDFFIASLNLEVEIKDGGDNPNNHHKIQAVDKVKEAKKDKVLENQKEFSYIKLVNKEYMPFVDYLLKRKEDFKEKAEGKPAEDVLDNKVVMESTMGVPQENMVWTVCPNPTGYVYRGCADIGHQYEGINPHQACSTVDYCNPHGIILEPIHRALYSVLTSMLAYAPANLEIKKLVWVMDDLVQRIEGRDEYDIVLHDHYAVAAIINKVLTFIGPEKAAQYRDIYDTIVEGSIPACKHRKNELNLEASSYSKQLEEFYELNVKRSQVGQHLKIYSTTRLDNPKITKGDKMICRNINEVMSCDMSIKDGSKVYIYRPIRPISYTFGDLHCDEDFAYSEESCEMELDHIAKVRRNVKDEYTETAEAKETDARFEKVYEAETIVERNRPVYVLLTHSGTLLANAIQKVTKEPYSHASISLDPQLKNMYSFGRKYKSNPLIGTFVRENIQAGLYEDIGHKTSYSLYVTFVSDEEYERIERCLQGFLEPGKKFKYNFIGLLRYSAGLETEREDAFFCSEFVASVLQAGNPERYFADTHRSMVKPYDFAKSKDMMFVTKGMLNYYDPNKVSAVTTRLQNRLK